MGREARVGYRIEEIEGIGKVYGDKLRAAGVTDTDALLAKTNSPIAPT
jgi:predicted flap endonuclease-1-like 5' DNA nuclease